MVTRSSSPGTVFQTSNGRWAAVVELPRKPNGTRNRKMRRARTQAEARRKLREMLDEVHRTGAVGHGRRTVNEAVEAYRVVRAGEQRSKSTQSSDDRKLQMISTGLGRRRLTELTVTDCDEFLQDCADGLEDGARPITTSDHLGRVRSKLANVLRNEIRTGNLSRNVAELAVLPPLDDSMAERRALTRPELAGLIDAASGCDLVLIDLSGRNALRPAEARATQWRNVDLDAGLLKITNQLNAAGELADVKTKESARTIRLDEATVARLATWRREQTELSAKALRWDNAEGLIATTRTGSAVDRNNFVRSLTSLCELIEIEKICPYELRHTAISHQADRGRTSWQIADWAGTSERMISGVYRHQLTQVSELTPED